MIFTTGVRRAAADKAERRLGKMRMGNQTRAILFEEPKFLIAKALDISGRAWCVQNKNEP
jgi:hypothetical protein